MTWKSITCLFLILFGTLCGGLRILNLAAAADPGPPEPALSPSLLPVIEVQTDAAVASYAVPGALSFHELLGVDRVAVVTEVVRVDEVFSADAWRALDGKVQLVPKLEWWAGKDMPDMFNWQHWSFCGHVATKWVYQLEADTWGWDFENLWREQLYPADMDDLIARTQTLIDCAKQVSPMGKRILVYPGLWSSDLANAEKARWFMRCLHAAWGDSLVMTGPDVSRPIAVGYPTWATLRQWSVADGIPQIPKLYCLPDGRADSDAYPKFWLPREIPQWLDRLRRNGHTEVILYPGAKRWGSAAADIAKAQEWLNNDNR